MTTVILTDTHIAHDHLVISLYHPYTSHVDASHKKVFVSPCETFLFGVDGAFDPAVLNKPTTYRFVKEILKEIIKACPKDETPITSLKNTLFMTMYEQIFSGMGQCLMVTKDHRYIVRQDKEEKTIKVAMCDDVVGLGTGGHLAEGLILGGMSIHGIWEKLVNLDHHTSLIHTVIDLDVLKPWREDA